MKNFLKNTYFCLESIITPVTLFLIILAFSFWSNPNLTPQISPDGQGYWELAKNFKSEVGLIRPFFFPFFIKLCMIISHENWQEIFSFFQIILHSSYAQYYYIAFMNLESKKCVIFIIFTYWF